MGGKEYGPEILTPKFQSNSLLLYISSQMTFFNNFILSHT